MKGREFIKRCVASALVGLCSSCLVTTMGYAGARYDAGTKTIQVTGAANSSLQSVASDLMQPDVFSYDFISKEAVCTANLEIMGSLTVGSKDNPSLQETLKMNCSTNGEFEIDATAGEFNLYHATVTASQDFLIREIKLGGQGVWKDSTIGWVKKALEYCSLPTLEGMKFLGQKEKQDYAVGLLNLVGVSARGCFFDNYYNAYQDGGNSDLNFYDCEFGPNNIYDFSYGCCGKQITAVNCSFNPEKVGMRKLFKDKPDPLFTVNRYLIVKVTDKNNNPVAGAKVIVSNEAAKGPAVSNSPAITDNNGLTPLPDGQLPGDNHCIMVTDYLQTETEIYPDNHITKGTIASYTYKIAVFKEGYQIKTITDVNPDNSWYRANYRKQDGRPTLTIILE